MYDGECKLGSGKIYYAYPCIDRAQSYEIKRKIKICEGSFDFSCHRYPLHRWAKECN